MAEIYFWLGEGGRPLFLRVVDYASPRELIVPRYPRGFRRVVYLYTIVDYGTPVGCGVGGLRLWSTILNFLERDCSAS